MVLNGGSYSAIPRRDGSFKLHGVRSPKPSRLNVPVRICVCAYACKPSGHLAQVFVCSNLRPSALQVAPGAYLLEVLDTQSVWPTVRLEVTATTPAKARALLTHSRQPLPFPLPLEPLVAKPTFFEKREGFQWSSLLMNPMVMMMGVTLLIMVVIPGMMKNMDPEALEEMRQMQSGGLASSTHCFAHELAPPQPKSRLASFRVC